MSEKWVLTSPEVWAVIFARHGKDLKVFSSYSNPTGDCHLGGGIPTMETSYGFDGSDFALVRAKTTWKTTWGKGDPEYKRVNEKHEYWLCLPKKDEDL